MKQDTRKHIILAIRIWLSALLLNSIFVTAIISGFFSSGGLWANIPFAGWVLAIGFLFSFPAALLFMLIMNISVTNEMNGRMLFFYLLIAGISLTTVAVGLFDQWMGATHGSLPFYGSALLSVVISIFLHYRPVLKAGHKSQHIDITFSEMDI